MTLAASALVGFVATRALLWWMAHTDRIDEIDGPPDRWRVLYLAPVDG